MTPWWTEMVKNLLRKAEITILPSWKYSCSAIRSGHVSLHTAGCTGGSYLIPLRRSCFPHLDVARACFLLPETLDLNHKVAKAASLMHEHAKSCSLKSTWMFHLCSEKSWLFDIQYQSCDQHFVSFKSHINFCPDPGWCLVCCAEGWLHSLRLCPVFE